MSPSPAFRSRPDIAGVRDLAPRATGDGFTRRIAHLSAGRRSRADGTARALVDPDFNPSHVPVGRASCPRYVRSNRHGSFSHRGNPPRRATRQAARLSVVPLALALLLGVPHRADASLLSPEAEDTLATFIALFVLFVVPVVLIVVFWLVHILPEQIAHKRHHPQFEAIRTLCLLSLVFGGLLWPSHGSGRTRSRCCTRWLRTDKHPDIQGARPPAAGGRAMRPHERVARARRPRRAGGELEAIRADLDSLEAKLAGSDVKTEVI